MKNRSASALLLGAAGIGAAAVYFLDPERGRRRRAQVRDKVMHLANTMPREIDHTFRDAQNRLRGLAAGPRSFFLREPAPDHILEERVRARVGHVVSDPHDLEVIACRGAVSLFGPILVAEVAPLIAAVHKVRGVTAVHNHLTELEWNASMPTWYAANVRDRQWLEPIPERWTPAARLGIGIAGAVLLGTALRRQGWWRSLLAPTGAGLLASAALNRSLRASTGLMPDHLGLALNKTIRIDAPLSDVFAFLADPMNYPKVFSHVQSIERVEENLYRWTVAGPAGTKLHWGGKIVKLEPNKLIAFASTTDSQIRNSGILRVEPHYDGSTRLEVRLTYRPPLSMVGQFIATLFGSDPEKVLEADLNGLRMLLETGRTKVRGHEVTREEVLPVRKSKRRETEDEAMLARIAGT
jgi:uncharacterized membrane protein